MLGRNPTYAGSDAKMADMAKQAGLKGYKDAMTNAGRYHDVKYNGIEFRMYMEMNSSGTKTGMIQNVHPK